MKYNYDKSNKNNNELYLAENNGLYLNYDEIIAGVERAREDIRCGRYVDGRTFIENLKRKYCNE